MRIPTGVLQPSWPRRNISDCKSSWHAPARSIRRRWPASPNQTDAGRTHRRAPISCRPMPLNAGASAKCLWQTCKRRGRTRPVPGPKLNQRAGRVADNDVCGDHMTHCPPARLPLRGWITTIVNILLLQLSGKLYPWLKQL
jgi:hypothetical protein